MLRTGSGRIAFALWVGALACAVLAARIPEPRHRLEYVRIPGAQGWPLRIIAYFPEPGAPTPAPAAVICQPLNSTPEYARLLALELVQEGFVALTFDWRGRGPGENRQALRTEALRILTSDAQAAVAWLRARREVNPRAVVVAGQSVGGTVAIQAGLADPAISAVAAIGIEADVSPELPRNLLWAVGLYDEFRVLNHMRDVFQASANVTAREDVTVGDFARGTARRLGVSPTADHFTEMQDAGIHREVTRWVQQAVGHRPAERAFRMETRAHLHVLAWFLSLGAALLSLHRMAYGRDTVLRASSAAVLGAMGALSFAGGAWFLLAADAAVWLLVFSLLAGAIGKACAETLWRGLQWVARAGMVFWASLLLTLAVNNVAYYAEESRYLLALPDFALRHALDGLYAYALLYPRPLLLSAYDPSEIALRWWMFAVPLLELVRPGVLLGAAGRLLARQPAATATATRPAFSRRNLIALAFLAVVLAAVAAMRIQQGFLTTESAWAALRYIFRFAVLPVFLFALLWRLTRQLLPD